MLCPEAVELAAFLNGSIEEANAEAIESHLSLCDACINQLQELECQFAGPNLLLADFHDDECNEYIQEAEFQSVLKRLSDSDSDSQLELASERDTVIDDSIVAPQLGEYRIVRRLGSGGMGVVYLAYHLRLGKLVAVKTQRYDSPDSEQRAARFVREAKAAGKLDHANIVRALDARLIDETQCLVMEFVHGYNLRELIEAKSRLPIAEAAEIIRQCAVGLQHAHENGIVHRDIKPRNLMINLAGQVKILDLGLARIRDEACDQELTQHSQVLGTLDYLPPEQFDDREECDGRMDIYSLGCTFYFLLSGEPPFYASTSPIKKIIAHTRSQPQSMTELRDDCPHRLWEIVNRMLLKDPEERFDSAQQVADALAPFAADADLERLLSDERLRPLETIDLEQQVAADADQTSAPVAVASELVTASQVPKSNRRFRPPTGRSLALALLFLACSIAAATFTYKLGSGTLIVKADDSVSILMRDDELKIRDLDRNQTYGLTVGESKLRPGSYEIMVSGEESGLSFSTDRFEIRRNETAAVEVSFTPTESPRSTFGSVESNSAGRRMTEREVAEWAFGIGAQRAYVQQEGRGRFHVHNRIELPHDFDLIALNFDHIKALNDTQAANLAALPNLEGLVLSDTSITDAGLEHIAKIESLHTLHLSYQEQITSAGIRQLHCMPNLRLFIMGEAPVGAAEAKEIASLPHIQRVHIGGDILTDEMLKPFGKSKQLLALHVDPAKIAGTGFKHLADSKTISFISVVSPELTLEGFKAMCGVRNVREFGANSYNIRDHFLPHLTQLGNLENLTIGMSSITNQSIETFAKLPRLKSLNVRLTKITDEFLAKIHLCEKLDSLVLSHNQITDEGLAELYRCKQLTSIDLRGTQVSVAGVRGLRNALPECEVMSDYPNR